MTSYWSPDYAGCGPTSYGTVPPRQPYLHRPTPGIERLNREQLQRLHDRIAAKIARGEGLTWAEKIAHERKAGAK